MLRHLSLLCHALLVLTAAHAAAEEAGVVSGFINKTVGTSLGERRYVLYVPREYDASKAWPLVVFLHGAGERGDDGIIQSEVGIGTAIRRNPDRFPALVLMPQCPKERIWDWEVLEGVEKAMADTQGNYAVDTSRIYLTGLSMGGFGTWTWGPAKSDVFAALMPICGGGRLEGISRLGNPASAEKFLTLEERVQRMAKMPVYAFHGADDEVVKPELSREMVELITAAGGEVKYEEFPETGHNSWDKAYGSAEAIAWLFEQKKP